MVTKELLAYLDSALKGGYKEEDLHKALIAAGWNSQDVLDGFAALKRAAMPPGTAAHAPAATVQPASPQAAAAPSARSTAPAVLSKLAPQTTNIAGARPAAPSGHRWAKAFVAILGFALLGGGGYWAYLYYFSITPEPPVVTAPVPQLPPPVPERIQLTSATLDTLPDTFKLASSSGRGNQFVFSPNGSKVAYKITQDKKEVLIINGNAGMPFDAIGLPLLAPLANFSANGEHNAYVGVNFVPSRMYSVIIDGQAASGTYDLAVPVGFLGDTLAYVTTEGKKQRMVAGGVSDLYDRIYLGSVTLNNAGTHLAYAASLGSTTVLTLDGTPFASGTILTTHFALSEDGKHLAFVVASGTANNATHTLMVDGASVGTYKTIDPVSLVINKDGKVAYAAQKSIAKKGEKEQWFAVIDGKEQGPYQKINPSTKKDKFAWSADGTHAAYVAQKMDGSYTVVLDGTELGSYKDIARPFTVGNSFMFNAQGELVYYVTENKVMKKVVNGVDSGQIFPQFTGSLEFAVSTKSGHIFIEFRKSDGKYYYAIDGKESAKGYEFLWPASFSNKEDFVGFGALDGKDLLWVVEQMPN